MSSNLLAADNNSPNEKYLEFAQIMGLNQMLEQSMKQTEESMKKQMSGVLSEIYQRLPDLTKEDKKSLDRIVNNYLNSITSSIDTEKAVSIYITELVKNMSKEEVEYAMNFYKSEKGKKALQTVSNAAQQLQTYMLTQIEKANSTNYPQFMNELDAFMKSVYE